jgi:hypothetical protein
MALITERLPVLRIPFLTTLFNGMMWLVTPFRFLGEQSVRIPFFSHTTQSGLAVRCCFEQLVQADDA